MYEHCNLVTRDIFYVTFHYEYSIYTSKIYLVRPGLSEWKSQTENWIHHLDDLFGPNTLTSSQLACFLLEFFSGPIFNYLFQ